jgi:inward rectifier potassium channel
MTKTNDPGLGSNYKNKIRRLINEDGSYNIKRHGGLRRVRDFYKFLIDLNWWQFLGLSLLAYFLINVLFACIYVLIGINEISGVNDLHSPFLNAFFFSVQTFTTVGYGHLSPLGLGTNIVAAFESFLGLMAIALITGLLYGRFSKPSSKIAFSKNVLITPYKNGNAVMFKMVNQRNSILLNSSVKVILILDKSAAPEDTVKEYHRVPLEIDTIDFFPLTWTVVHEINEESPLFNASFEEVKSRNAELIILVEAFDETHSQVVMERRSYAQEQWLENVKFARNFRTNEAGEIELFIQEIDNLSSLDK